MSDEKIKLVQITDEEGTPRGAVSEDAIAFFNKTFEDAFQRIANDLGKEIGIV